MSIMLGDRVWTRGGELVGVVDRVVMDAVHATVKTIAIRQGGLRPLLEAPVSGLRDDPTQGARLTCDRDGLCDLSRFDERAYTAPSPDYLPPLGTGHAMAPVGYSYEPALGAAGNTIGAEARRQLAVTLAQQDLEHAVIAGGCAILDHAGQKAGALHQLEFEAETGRVLALTVRQGFFFSRAQALPGGLIERLTDGVIQLAAEASWLDMLAEVTVGTEVWTSDRHCLGVVTARTPDYLEVTRTDPSHQWHIPLMAAARVSRNRLILTEDHARVLLDR